MAEKSKKIEDSPHFQIEGERIRFARFAGEFGWEIMAWAPFCRYMARGFPEVEITSFAASEALYDDFCTTFVAAEGIGRTLDYPKSTSFYCGRPSEHRRYGTPGAAPRFDCLVHARGISRKHSTINYRSWQPVVEALADRGLRVACVGTDGDLAIFPAVDLRGMPNARLMDFCASARLTIGGSSGGMHLAAACGCPLVVWGDTKTRYRQTLEVRYKLTWNPHGVAVHWIPADDWQPAPQTIIEEIDHALSANP
ncbi:MAG: hypothetical protein ACYTAN_06885 [Planctomycetota bacterium]